MKISKEAKIGFLATVAILAAIWGYKFLKGENILDRSLTLYADFEDAQQINKSAPIYFRGVDVGTVKDIVFMPEKNGKATLILNIRQNPGVPKNAVAQIFANGVLSGKAINLLFDKSCTTGDCAQNEDVIRGAVLNALESMLGSPANFDPYVEKVSRGLNVVLDTLDYRLTNPQSEVGQSLRDIQATLAALRQTTATLNKVMAASASSLNTTMSNVASITGNLNSNNEKINSLLSNISEVSGKANGVDFSKINKATEGVNESLSELKKTLGETQKSLGELSTSFKKINSGEGTIGQFATNDSLYHTMNLTLLHTEALIQDLRLNPKRYINLNPFRRYKPYIVPSQDPLLDTLQRRFNANKK
jgi:phospholipid/cholesterol/gamma-HCH transport system substrate-binding protein